jgi:hypothetical protein
MPIFGITASSNMSTKLTDFYQIATTTVGSGGAASVTFSSIPSDYTHLQVRGLSLSSAACNYYFRFNSDTGSNYSWHELYGDGAGATSFAGTSTSFGYFNYSPSGTNPTVFALDILDYKDTNKFKTVKAIAGNDNNGSGRAVLSSSNWRSTSAITSMLIYPSTGTFSQYSSFQLYGIKG